MWVLSQTGQVQTECVWVAWSASVSAEVREQLPALAEQIKEQTNQDCVCFEVAGELRFTSEEAE